MKQRGVRGDGKRRHEEQIGTVLVFHPKSPDATPESVLAVAGIVRLTGPVPSWKLFEEGEPESEVDPGGG